LEDNTKFNIIEGKENISFQFLNDIKKDVHDILHIQGLAKIFLSISKMTNQHNEASFNVDVYLKKQDKTLIYFVRLGTLCKILCMFEQKIVKLFMKRIKL